MEPESQEQDPKSEAVPSTEIRLRRNAGGAFPVTRENDYTCIYQIREIVEVIKAMRTKIAIRFPTDFIRGSLIRLLLANEENVHS